MKSSRHSALLTLPLGALVCIVAGCATTASAPPEPAPPPAAPAPAANGAATTMVSSPVSRPRAPRPFERVVPPHARSDSGLFVVHRTDDRLYFEIPDSLMGREMLVISSIASVPANLGDFIPAGYKAQEQVLAWQRQGNRVLLRKLSFEQVAPDSAPIALSVQRNNFAPIIASFEVQAIGPDSNSVVLDVTRLFEGDVPALSGLNSLQRQRFGVRRLDPERSFITTSRAYPLNVEVGHTATFEAANPPSDAGTGTISMEMRQSMVLLPAVPMRPRYADPRVGYFSVEQVNYGLPDQKAGTQSYIRRWRLEPSDPEAYAQGKLVEPIQPIVYYLDPATPAEYRQCVRAGVEDWQPAFETAGFRNAILARDPPSHGEDPDWHPDDVRNSVVRWAASLTRNAQGPSVSDPRSGEIIESDIVWYHNHLRSYRNRLIVETGATNPQVRSLPIDHDLLCQAVRQVIAHEVGHALGLPHNMISSSAYPVDSLRSPEFARRMGVAPSIMDYARQNYVAQPGDGLEGEEFLRRIGPYDHYAIDWGYRVIPDASTAEEERPTLNDWIRAREHDPVYRYLPQNELATLDPRAQTEDIGDDPVQASTLGILNLQRVLPNLPAWTARPGEDYTELAELYQELEAQWFRYVGHVANVIGGVYVDLKSTDQGGPVYRPVHRVSQEEALAFLEQQVFQAPVWLLDREVLSRVGDVGGVHLLSRRQAAVVNFLLASERLGRMAEHELLEPDLAYPLAEYLEAVRQAVWRDAAVTARDPYRRALQRAHVERLIELLRDTGPSAPAAGAGPQAPAPGGPNRLEVARSDIRPLARAELEAIRRAATASANAGGDRVARAHLRDVVERIREALEAPRLMAGP